MTGARGTVRTARGRRTRVRGLVLHLLAFLALSTLLFVGGFGSWLAVGWSLVAPPYVAILWAGDGDQGMVVVSVLVTLAALVTAVLAVRSPTRNRRLLLHVALVPYEVWSLTLVGLGA